MRRASFLTTFLSPATFIAFLLACPLFVFAQGETFDNCDDWTASVCGMIVDGDFDSIVGFDGNAIPDGFFGGVPTPQTLLWGELSQEGNAPAAIAYLSGEGDQVTLFDDGRPIVFTLDPNLEQLEGVCFQYNMSDEDSDITFKAFDGDTLVATAVAPLILDENGEADSGTFGWQNTDGLNITRFEFCVAEGVSTTGLVGNGQLSFGDGCDPPETSCFDELTAVKAEIEALLATSTGNDACYVAGALDCVCWMQNDCFWEQPSGNRLSVYGGSMFIGAAYTVCYLEWVDDPQADVIIDQLLDVLECIVDNEIAYAIENGGNQCYIDRAEDFAELGDIIDEDFDNQVVATLAYRLAWLNAYYSTYGN